MIRELFAVAQVDTVIVMIDLGKLSGTKQQISSSPSRLVPWSLPAQIPSSTVETRILLQHRVRLLPKCDGCSIQSISSRVISLPLAQRAAFPCQDDSYISQCARFRAESCETEIFDREKRMRQSERNSETVQTCQSEITIVVDSPELQCHRLTGGAC
jgi:hypothetical protein